MARRLLTFAPMINAECSRFLLAHYGVPYAEEPHIFIWVSVLGLFRGRTVEVPQLYGDGPACIGPRGIFDRYDKTCAPERRLMPADRMQAMQVEADWERFNGVLAGPTAVLAYYHLLPRRDIMLEPFRRGIPAFEAKVTPAAYPVVAGLFNLLLRLNPAHAAEALDETRILFEEAARRLAGGRRYLVGDGLTLGDVALATAAAPLLLPPNYAAPIPPLETMPLALQAIVAELRAHPVAAYVERIFRDHRLGVTPA